ncbi:hypothetical protein LTS17_007974 [Exophiala oligosperma]
MAEKSEAIQPIGIPAAETMSDYEDLKAPGNDDFEVFKKSDDAVDFRTVGWPHASIILLKIQFALGVLNLPTVLYIVGALPGALLICAWGAYNTYSAVLLGAYRNRHPGIHTQVEMAYRVGGIWFKELTGALFIIGNVLCVSAGLVGVSTGINALSHHAACTVWWGFLAMVAAAGGASIRKLARVGYIMWVGFISLFVATFIVVVAVTTRDRPAAAPPTGPFELGYRVIGHPNFLEGVTSCSSIFVASAGASAFVPVISEMRNPKDYKKAIYAAQAMVNSSYLTFSLVVYAWCGQWVASPALGSAGQTIKMIAYGIALPGLFASTIVYLHIAAKYIFVRLLRDSVHLQSNSVVHWSIWLGLTFGLATIAFIIYEAVPILNYLLSLMGSVCFAPLCIIFPPIFWLHDFNHWRKGTFLQQLAWVMHIVVALIGAFLTVAGTYGTIRSIIDAYAQGIIGGAFSCADNSNSS